MGEQCGRLTTPQVCRVSWSRLFTGHPCQATGAEGGGRSAGAGAGPRAHTALPRGREQDPRGAEAGHAWGTCPQHSEAAALSEQRPAHRKQHAHCVAGSRVGSQQSFGQRKRALFSKAKVGAGRRCSGRGPPGVQMRPGWKGNKQRKSSASFCFSVNPGKGADAGEALARDKTHSWGQG